MTGRVGVWGRRGNATDETHAPPAAVNGRKLITSSTRTHRPPMRLLWGMFPAFALLAAANLTVTLQRLSELPPRWETALRGVQPAVASIRDGDHRGSGVNLGPEGLVLTANHVVGSSEVDVHLADGSPWRGRVVLRDPVRDLALVALTGGEALPVARLAPAPPLVDDEFVLIGCPVSCDRRPFAPVRGRLLAFRADRDGRQTLGATAHDAGTDWGHSGSPLFNATGEVIALHNSWNERTGTRHAVSWEAIAAFLANTDVPSLRRAQPGTAGG